MQSLLQDYIPQTALSQVLKLLEHDHLVVKIKKERKTQYGIICNCQMGALSHILCSMLLFFILFYIL